jgi:hypothetical protein
MRPAQPTTISAQNYQEEPLFIANSRRLLARIALINDQRTHQQNRCANAKTPCAEISLDEKINAITQTFR